MNETPNTCREETYKILYRIILNEYFVQLREAFRAYIYTFYDNFAVCLIF